MTSHRTVFCGGLALALQAAALPAPAAAGAAGPPAAYTRVADLRQAEAPSRPEVNGAAPGGRDRAPDAVGLLLAEAGSGAGGEQAGDGSFLVRQGPQDWRASKLIGLPVYGADDRSIGGINDILISPAGQVVAVVVGVGGFLGIGQKDVAIASRAVRFVAEPPKGADNGGGGALVVDRNAGNGGGGNNGGNGGGGSGGGGSGGATRSTLPNHGVVAFSAAQLSAAPAFQFEP